MLLFIITQRTISAQLRVGFFYFLKLIVIKTFTGCR